MSVWNQEISPAATAGLISDEFNATGNTTITAGVLLAGEGVLIQYSHDGTTWQDLYFNGVLQEITNQHSLICIHGPIKLRCVKSVTANPVSVVIWRSEAE